jgi:hypothetical protein
MSMRSDEAHVQPTVRTVRSMEGSTVTCERRKVEEGRDRREGRGVKG